jgi:hypothetical protein
MSLVAASIFLRPSKVCGRVWYISEFRSSQKEKSRGVMSGDLGGHSICPLHPIHCSGRTSLRQFRALPATGSGAASC